MTRNLCQPISCPQPTVSRLRASTASGLTCALSRMAALLLLLFFFQPNASAQAEDDLPTLVNRSLNAMKAEQWEEALAINTRIVERYGKNQPLMLFGPRFGTIYYRKGLCEMKLKQYAAAEKSFETCYKDFPNNAEAGGGNTFRTMALLKWAEAAKGAGNWDTAIEKFKQFLEERQESDTYHRGLYHVNLAICLYNTGKIAEGNENLELAIKNRVAFRTPESGIVAGFQALATASVERNQEQELLDFIGRHRSSILTAPREMQRYAPVFLKLAGQALEANMRRASIALYQLVPSTRMAIDDANAVIRMLDKAPGTVRDGGVNNNRARLATDVSALEATIESGKTNEAIQLASAAFLHERGHNVRGAYAAYLQLERFFSRSPRREDNLYNLVRTSSLVASPRETQRHAETFLRHFPESRYVADVRRLMLAGLFFEGDYETCVEIASAMLPTLQEGTEVHDMCLHVLGGSLYYTGQYDKAEPFLDQHVEKYPESPFAVSALYFQASNPSKLQVWSKSARLLDAFLKKHPEIDKNPFLPFALYDRANCHYAEDQPDEARTILQRITTEFPDANITDQAWNLLGNIEQSAKNFDLAEQAYRKALELADTRHNNPVISDSLYFLVALLGAEPASKDDPNRFEEAIPFADRFWKDFADDTFLKARFAVAQMPAMVSVGRGEEALKRLQEVISEMAKMPEAIGLEEAINSYTEAYLANHSPEELKEHYYNFPDIRVADRAARALLRIAIIGVFEELGKSTEDEAVKRRADAMSTVLFQELHRDFAVKDLSSYILVRIGDYLRTGSSAYREALPYYDEAIKRQDPEYLFAALLGRAESLGRSSDNADLAKAIEDYKRVFENTQERSQRDTAHYRIAALHNARGEHTEAINQARAYLDRQKTGYSANAPQVGKVLADSLEKSGNLDEALATYTQVWTSHMGFIEVSAPALLRWMELSWSRNRKSTDPAIPDDRQAAYESGKRFLEITGRFFDKMSASDQELWKEVEKRFKTYEADPNIRRVESIQPSGNP